MPSRDDDAAWSRPATLTEALAGLATRGAIPAAGGISLALVAASGGLSAPIVDLGAVPELAKLHAHPKIGLFLGSMVRLRTIESEIWIAKRWSALHEATEQILPPQIHTLATIGGNLCAADPLNDLATALAAHRATLRISSADAAPREVAVTDFYPATGRTALGPGELLLAIVAPRPLADAGSAFRKIGLPGADAEGRGKLQVAASVALDTATDGIVEATLALGGLGAGPIRAHDAEARLTGARAGLETYAAVARATVAAHAPAALDSVGRQWLFVLIRDVLDQAASRARSRHDPFEDSAALIEASR